MRELFAQGSALGFKLSSRRAVLSVHVLTHMRELFAQGSALGFKLPVFTSESVYHLLLADLPVRFLRLAALPPSLVSFA
jgi:hypothetical protein